MRAILPIPSLIPLLSLFTVLVFTSTSSAHRVLDPRQLASTSLTFDFTRFDGIYRSTSRFYCPRQPLLISGAVFPVQVDIVKSFNPRKAVPADQGPCHGGDELDGEYGALDSQYSLWGDPD
ncbi:hypothetical protein JCM8547_005556 [Rhodosporidiobolus lusitaniae]